MNEFVAANIRPSEVFSIQVGSFFKGLKKFMQKKRLVELEL